MSAYLALSAALPALHSCALQLVQTLLWTGQGSLLPHYAPMARMMANALRHIAAAPTPDPAPAAAHLRQQVSHLPTVCITTGQEKVLGTFRACQKSVAPECSVHSGATRF